MLVAHAICSTEDYPVSDMAISQGYILYKHKYTQMTVYTLCMLLKAVLNAPVAYWYLTSD